MSRTLRLTAAVAALVTLSSCSPPLPKAYGVYAREGRTLVDLTDKEASDDWDLADNVVIVVFERELVEQGFTPDRDLTLHRTAYARSEQIYELHVDGRSAQELLNRGPGGVPKAEVASLPVRKRSAAQKAIWIIIGGPISVRYEPVADHRDMIVVVPDSPLPTGTYVLTISSPVDERARGVSFAVGLSDDLKRRQDATCVDEYLYTVRRPESFQGWDQWFKDIDNMAKEQGRRRAGGNPVLAASTEPCSVADEAAKGWLRVPSYIQDTEASVLKSWLFYNPSLRAAEPRDCGCDGDLAARKQSYENPHPYYVKADFNRDGNQDFAVTLLDTQSNHEWNWTAALAVFNGPLYEGMAPAFFKNEMGSPQGSLLCYSSNEPLLIGPWESEAQALKPSGNTYILD